MAAKRNGISPAKALKQICIFAEELNNRMHNGEEAEIDAEALSALVDDNAGPEMTAQFGKPFVSAPTEDGYETELLEETLEEPSYLYSRDADPFEDEDDCEEYEEKEETDEIILDEEDEELDEEEGDAEGLD